MEWYVLEISYYQSFLRVCKVYLTLVAFIKSTFDCLTFYRPI